MILNNIKSKFIDKISNYSLLRIYFTLYFSIFFINILYNQVNIFIFPELSINYKTFLFYPEDRFADFFKFGAAFNNFKPSPELFNISFIAEYLIDNPYLSNVTIYHQPPLPFLIYALIAFISKFINIFYFFIFLVISLLALISKVLMKHSQKFNSGILFCFFSSYPLIFMIDRGHILSLLIFLFLLLSIICISSNKNKYAIFFMTLAICMKPTFVFLSLILLPVSKSNFKLFSNNIIKIFISGAIITSVLYLILSNFFYLEYNLQNILKGLDVYKIIYIENIAGQNYGTSFYFFISFFTKSIPVIWTFIFLFFIINFFLFFRIPFKSENLALHLWLLINSVFIITPVNADYYLLLYFIPLYLVLNEKNNVLKTQSVFIIVISSILLAPKNIFISNITIASTINVIFVFISWIILFYNKFFRSRLVEYKN